MIKINTTQRLCNIIDDRSVVSQEVADEVLLRVEQLMQLIDRAMSNESGHGLKMVYALLDRTVAEVLAKSPPVSCKARCSSCCHDNVDISRAEGEYIIEYCREHNIEIDKSALEEQLKVTAADVRFSPKSACVFLKDGLCSIYPIRPVTCRTHFVVTPAALCEKGRYQRSDVIYFVSYKFEMFISAFTTIHPVERMPTVLLTLLNNK